MPVPSIYLASTEPDMPFSGFFPPEQTEWVLPNEQAIELISLEFGIIATIEVAPIPHPGFTAVTYAGSTAASLAAGVANCMDEFRAALVGATACIVRTRPRVYLNVSVYQPEFHIFVM